MMLLQLRTLLQQRSNLPILFAYQKKQVSVIKYQLLSAKLRLYLENLVVPCLLLLEIA